MIARGRVALGGRSGDIVTYPGAGPAQGEGASGRPVVRPAGSTGRTLAAAATLAWPAGFPSGGPAVPVVTEQSAGGAGHPGWPASGQPVPLPVAQMAATARPAAGQAGAAAAASAASAARQAAGPGEQDRATRDQLTGRRADRAGRDRERTRAAQPQLDVNHIISTVQRQFMHQLAIERERRGMLR